MSPSKSCSKPKPKCTMPIRYCPPAPPCQCPSLPTPPKSTFRCYGPCRATRSPCPASWPALLPNVRCCRKPPVVQDPLALPVMPVCQSPRWSPEPCKKKVLTEIRVKEYPPLIPFCSPCRPLSPPPCPRRRVRYLDPVIPPCIRTCPPPPCRRLIPEPPYPPFCPVLPPCNCPAIPLICHNSVMSTRPTSLCDKAKDINNPNVCYTPVDRMEVAQICCDMGYCIC